MRWSPFKSGESDSAVAGGPRPRSRHAALKWTGGILASLIAIVVLVLVFLDWNAMRGPIGRYLSLRLHREVRLVGDLNVRLFSWTPTAVVNDLVIEQPQWVAQGALPAASAFANVQRLMISLDLTQLLRWRIVLPTVDVERPRLNFLRDETGRANWKPIIPSCPLKRS